MKLLVCISKTPDTTAKIAFNGDNTKLETAGITFIMNPYDEWYALVKALEIQEKWGGTVSILHVGPAENDSIIRKALAIGATDAFRIDTEAVTADQVAFQLALFIKQNAYDIIFTGKETIDYNGAEVGGRIAAQLDLPFISFASHLEMASDNVAIIKRDMDGGTETIQVNTPFVVSAAKGMAEQRIPNMKGIMTAKSKPLNVVTPQAYLPKISIVSHELPPAKKAVQYIDPENMAELARLLREEAKVI
jgi:electron transfer flavoprotein beta subunit